MNNPNCPICGERASGLFFHALNHDYYKCVHDDCMVLVWTTKYVKDVIAYSICYKGIEFISFFNEAPEKLQVYSHPKAQGVSHFDFDGYCYTGQMNPVLKVKPFPMTIENVKEKAIRLKKIIAFS